MSVFTHANLRLPQRFESALGTLFVTPKVHRVHHSIEIDEQHCNFGFDLTAWDRLFGTFRSKSRSGSGARLGLDATQRNADLGLLELLKQPFSPTYLL
jgi:sterol desaturase/sphingolipid hydroxylase (fatty acid hydroxylase superfamily)